MSCFIKQVPRNRLFAAVLACVFATCCAKTEAQQLSTEDTSTFELSGKVISKSESSFDVQTKDGQIVEVATNESTDFAMRLSSPWFSGTHRMVAVDGKMTGGRTRQRINYSLPKGQLYLLVQFRNVAQRDRIMKQPIWRLNNYLISDQPIESGLPEGRELLLAGKLDLENSTLTIGEKSWPIRLGYRNATLRGRSLADIVANETVVLVSGNVADGAKTADTVLFMIR